MQSDTSILTHPFIRHVNSLMHINMFILEGRFQKSATQPLTKSAAGVWDTAPQFSNLRDQFSIDWSVISYSQIKEVCMSRGENKYD